LLTQVSETRQKARVNKKVYEKSNSKAIKSVFDFFCISEEEVDNILQNIYSPGNQNITQ